jgi:hypothetical protein
MKLKSHSEVFTALLSGKVVGAWLLKKKNIYYKLDRRLFYSYDKEHWMHVQDFEIGDGSVMHWFIDTEE